MSSKASCSLLVQRCHFICLLCRTNVFVATFWLKSWFTLATGLGFHPVNCLPVGKCEGGGCHSPAAWQGCAYASPWSSEDGLSDRRHAAEPSPCYSDQSWPFRWCQSGPGQHGVSCGELLWCSGDVQRVRSWLRGSPRWCYPDWNVRHSLQMLLCSSQGETQQFWGLDGNFTTC